MNRMSFRIGVLLVLVMLIMAGCSSTDAPAADSAAPAAADTAAATAAPVVEPAPAITETAPSAALTDTTAATATAPSTETAAVSETAAATETAPSTDTAATRTFAIDPASSSAQYEVAEEFLGRNLSFVQTVGKTQAIEGSIALDVNGSALTVGDNAFTVDLSTLTSDQPRRDNAIRRDWLQSSTYPTATFTATGVSGLPADAALGSAVDFKLSGDITIRAITKPVTWNVTATLDGSALSGQAQSVLLMRDFGFEPPDIAGMLKVTDGVTVTVDFVANEVK